ncbi:MAG: hypothetical protein II767_01135 [Proteobacteria bacterium]|nr:hypothetical protein [Pseudomonadota bacterium]
MKHLSIILLSLALPLCLTSCQKQPKDNATPAEQNTQAQEQPNPEPAQESPKDTEKAAPTDDAAAPDTAQTPDTAPTDAAAGNDFIKTSGDWSDMQIEIRSFPESSDDKDKAQIKKDIAELLQKWNNLRNLKGYEKLDKLYGDTAYLRGSVLPHKDITAKLKKSFEKHKDFSQTPGIHVTVDYLFSFKFESIEKWSVRFDESFTQDGKTTDTEIFMVLSRKLPDDAQSFWSIEVESDIATDRNMLKKLDLALEKAPTSCESLAYQILLDSPMLRYEINTMYEGATAGIKSGELDGISLDSPISETLPSENSKHFGFDLTEEHAADPDNPEDAGRSLRLNGYGIDFEEMKIEDENHEIFHAIEPRYLADIKRLCK